MEMYIPLKARIGTPEGETWARELRVAGRPVSEEEASAMGHRISASEAVLNLLTTHNGLIVLGDPGAGKTTLLKFLGLSLATGQGEALGLGTRLPVLVPLSAYATALKPGEADIPLDRFIGDYYRDRGVALSIDALLEQALRNGKALLLLDGLDEVRDSSQRQRVVGLVVDFFATHRKAGNKFVLTSRIVGYSDVRPRVEGLAECTLVDLEDEEIEVFVDKWTAALERAARGQSSVTAFEAERERDELLSAIWRNPSVKALAVNPLLLTILALMKRQNVDLPERRVQLYQAYVETLLKHWKLGRSLTGGRVGRDLDVVETIRILAPLALWMHRTSPSVGLVPKEKLKRELEVIYQARRHADPERAAREFLEDVLREEANLLLNRGGNQLGFIHLTFQEYLAGVALTQKGQQDVGPIIDELAAHVGDDTWHEVSLLAIGFLGIVQQRDEAASEVLIELIKRAPGTPGEAVTLAGEAMADAGPGGVTPAAQQQVLTALLQTMRDDEHVKPKQRAEAGRALAACGDSRFDRTCWFLPKDKTLGFREILTGQFLMGSDKRHDKAAFDNELRQHPVELPRYYLARWPVTVAQFRVFVETGGYTPEDPECLKGKDNHPVVRVTWYDAAAYCVWLNEHLQVLAQERLATGSQLPSPEFWQGLAQDTLGVGLPSEAEWEKATRGVDGRVYPWGGEAADPDRANYVDTGIGTTTAVGCFPGGASPYGCEEMSGNVWEWTRSLWGGYPYPKTGVERQAREDLSADSPRVLRGGSFDYIPEFMRCAYRYFRFPVDRANAVGFRVVVSPFFSGR